MHHPIVPVRVSAPAEMPVTLADAKSYLCVENTDDDALITALIASVTDHLDGYSGVLGRCLIRQTWTAQFPCFPLERLRFPFGQLAPSAVVSISYRDVAGVEQTLSSELYHVVEDAVGPCAIPLWGTVWPPTAFRPDAVSFTAELGYGDAGADVPAALRQAILLLVGQLYAERATTMSNRLVANPAADRMLNQYRRVPLA